MNEEIVTDLLAQAEFSQGLLSGLSCEEVDREGVTI
jgi:hypothetical protein